MALINITDGVFDNNTTNTVTWNNGVNTTLQNSKGIVDSGYLSKKTTDDITFAIECITMPIIGVFGIIGNILSLIVLLNRKLRSSSTTVLLIGLAISDCLFLVTMLIRKSTCIISRFDEMLSYEYFVTSFASMYYVNTCFSRVSTLLVAVMSVERVIAVVFPLKVKLVSTKMKMAITVVFVYLFTFAFLSLLLTQTKVEYIAGTPFIKSSVFYLENQKFMDIYTQYITVTIFRWLPKVIVVVCNSVIITFLWRRKIPTENAENVSSMSNYPRTQRKVTVMLVTVAIIFVVALLPGDAFLITGLVVDGFEIYGKYNNLFVVLSNVALTFEIINSSINFVIYMVLNKTFSEIYRRLFCCCLFGSERFVRQKTSKRHGVYAIGTFNHGLIGVLPLSNGDTTCSASSLTDDPRFRLSAVEDI